MLKSLQESFSGLKVSTAHTAAIESPEFDTAFKDFKTTPEWTQHVCAIRACKLISALHDTLRSNESSLRENVAATSAFLLLLDDPRSGRATQELSRDMHDTLLEWHSKEASDVSMIRRAEGFLAKFLGVVQQTCNDIVARNRTMEELCNRRAALDRRVEKLESEPSLERAPPAEPGTTRPAREVERIAQIEEKVVKNNYEVEMLTGKFDVLNRQAVSGMRKVSDMRPRVAYAMLYAYAHYQHNALGTKPVQIHAERLAEQNPQLAEAIDWDDVEIEGETIKHILARDDMSAASDAAAA